MGRELVALRLANVADDWPIPDADPVTEVMPTTDDRLPPDDGQPVNTAEEWLIRVTRGVAKCVQCNIDFDEDFLDDHVARGGDRSNCAHCNSPVIPGRLSSRVNGVQNVTGMHCIGPRVYTLLGGRVTNRDDTAWQGMVLDGNLVRFNAKVGAPRVAPVPGGCPKGVLPCRTAG